MITPVSRSSRASSRAFCISMTVSGRKAFLTSGRFMVIFAIPSAFSYLMSSNSPADSQATLVIAGIIWDLNIPDRGSSSTAEVHQDRPRERRLRKLVQPHPAQELVDPKTREQGDILCGSFVVHVVPGSRDHCRLHLRADVRHAPRDPGVLLVQSTCDGECWLPVPIPRSDRASSPGSLRRLASMVRRSNFSSRAKDAKSG